MNDVFISYSRRDKVFVQKLYECLRDANRTVWADWDSIPASSDWFAEIKQGIEETDSVVFVLSPEWIKSNECRKEMNYAVEMGKRLFPILYIPVDPKDVPPELGKINWIYMRDNDDFDKGFETLCSALDTDLEWIKLHTRIQVRALEWEKKNRSASFALRGEDLTEGEQFVASGASKNPVPTALQSEYILDSRKDATRRQRQTLIGVTVALVVSIVLGVVAFFQRQEAVKQETIARSQLLAVNVKLDSSKVLHNLLLGIESYQMVKDFSQPDKVVAEQALRDTLSQVHGIPFIGHNDVINTLAFSPDGRWLATGSSDGSVRLWDMQNSSNEPVVLRGHDGLISTLVFSPNGHWLVTDSDDKTVRLWNMQNLTAEPIVLNEHKDLIYALAISPDSRWLAISGDDTTVDVWDIQNPTIAPVVLSDHKGSIYCLSISVDSRWLVSGSADNTARLWDMHNPTAEPTVLQQGDSLLYSVVFSPDGRWLATLDGTVRLWDMRNRSAKPVVLSGYEGVPESLTFSPNGRWLALLGLRADRGIVSVWDMQDPSVEPTTSGEENIVALAFSPDERWLAMSSIDATLGSTTVFLDMQDPYAQSINLRGHEIGITTLAFSPNGRWLASGSMDKTARLWDLQSFFQEPIILQGYDFVFSIDGRQMATVSNDVVRMWELQNSAHSPLILREHVDHSHDVTLSPNGRWLVTSSGDTTANLWDIESSTRIPIPLQVSINNVKFSSDSRWLVTGSREEHTVYLWDMQSPSSEPLLRNGVEYDLYNTLSRDGHWLVTESLNGSRSNRTARLWSLQDPTSKPIILNEPGEAVPTFAFTPDSQWFLSISENAIHVQNLQNLSAEPIPLYENRRDSIAYAPYFSPDGNWLVWVNEDKTTRLWDLQNITGEPVRLGRNQLFFNDLTFSPDDHWLITRSPDEITRLWDTHNFDKQPIILDECESFQSLVFSGDSGWLAASCVDSTIRVLNLQEPTAEPLILHVIDSSIASIAVSPNGRWFAVSGTDSTSLWDMADSAAPPILLGDDGYAHNIAFSPDSQWLVISGIETLTLWNMDYDHLMEMACKVVGRNLTRAEWTQYFPDEDYRKTCEQWPLEVEPTSTATATP